MKGPEGQGRNGPYESGWQIALKTCVFQSYAKVWRAIPRRYLGLRRRQRLVVLLYHRVNDDLRDGVTVGVEQFARQMDWISRRHPLVDLEDALRGDIPLDARRTLVAVTFDDGYLDNYLNAVPVLLRYRVPAAFFVSTGKIGNGIGFHHDIEKLGRVLPTMNWDHLREMRDLGFIIGSHTVNHVDLGYECEDTVRTELTESMRKLRSELRIRDLILAYPFGGRENITPRALEIVKETGYIGCLSACGGYNQVALDPFNVLRTNINCNFTNAAFRARLEGFNYA